MRSKRKASSLSFSEDPDGDDDDESDGVPSGSSKHHKNYRRTLLMPPTNPQRSFYGTTGIPSPLPQNVNESDDGDDDDDSDCDLFFFAKERLLERAGSVFALAYSPERGYRATEFQLCTFQRPHMRALHASWLGFFASGACQFAMAPLLPQLQESLHLSKRDIWWTTVWMMVGGVPMRFLLGPLCDLYGPRVVMVWIVVLCAIPCALSGLLVVNFGTLLVVRLVMGAMDAFVPCQCWITSHFVREVGGTLMAIAGGLGASGAGFTQVAVGLFYAICLEWTDGNENLSWRLALLFPAAFALLVAWWAYQFSDDCPLGNFWDVKKAGLMMERSAVDSFRSGVHNFNSWLLFLQFAGCCGVDVTMCNGCAIYFHEQFHQSIPASGAIAFLYGVAAIYARGWGGYISDRLGDRFQLQGRLWMHFVFMILQGAFNIWFARTTVLNTSMIIMVIFSIFVQVRYDSFMVGIVVHGCAWTRVTIRRQRVTGSHVSRLARLPFYCTTDVHGNLLWCGALRGQSQYEFGRWNCGGGWKCGCGDTRFVVYQIRIRQSDAVHGMVYHWNGSIDAIDCYQRLQRDHFWKRQCGRFCSKAT